MKKIQFTNANDAEFQSLVESILHDSQNLSSQKNFTGDDDTYIDIEDPNVSEYLESSEVENFIADVADEPQFDKGLLSIKRGKLKRFKEKIRRAFCFIISQVNDINQIDWKEVIKKVLLYVASFFSLGLPALLITILVTLIAKVLKRGVNNVCPI